MRSLVTSTLISALEQALETATVEDRFSGAVLVARDGRRAFAQAYGLADREREIPAAIDTKFRIGSISKMLTGTAVVQLVQAGKLRLEAQVEDYLPDYPNPAFASRVSIHQLLTHTAGAGDIFTPVFTARRGDLREPEDYLAAFGDRDPEFTPGDRYSYSNYGFVVLGRIVEVVSGQCYDDFVEEHILQPAGMSATGALPEAVNVPARSVGYTHTPRGWVSNIDTLPYRGTPAGGGYSTVEDLFSFAQALTSNRLLDPAHTRLLTAGKVEVAPDFRYAYGFGEIFQDGVRYVGHSGGAPGMNGDLRIVPESGYVVVVLANRDPPAATNIADFLVQRLSDL